jgi:O-antigen/teichoic acid export membrane protein
MPQEKQLDHSLVSGIVWTAALRWPAHVISWAATAFAARILTPGDYGIVSMATIAIGLARMVEDFGMDAVFVQDRTITGTAQARLAGLVVGTGIALCLLFVALAHPIAAFFREPAVAPVIMLLSLLCVFDGLQVVARAGLQREMKFARLAWAQFIQMAVTQASLVGAALLGWGAWSLVFSTLFGAFTVTLLLLVWHPYAVGPPRELARLAHPLMQGWRILASRAAYYAYNTADQTIVGRILGKEALGAYSFAVTFSTTISQEISSVVTRVVPGVFSEVQCRREELKRYFLILTELLAYLALPVSLGLALIADFVVAIVLGPQWRSVVMPLRILCIYAAYFTTQVLIGPLVMWTGQFRANMWLSILTGITLPVGFIIGARWGLAGVAWAWAICFPLTNVPAMVIAFRTIRSDVWSWLNAIRPATAACLAMSLAVITVRSFMPNGLPTPVATAVSIAVGAAAYFVALQVFFRQRVRNMVAFVRVLRGSRNVGSSHLALSED